MEYGHASLGCGDTIHPSANLCNMKKQGIDWNDSLADFKHLLFGPDDPRISQLGVGGYKSAIVKGVSAIARNIDEFPRYFKAKTGPNQGKYLLKVPKGSGAKSGKAVQPKSVRTGDPLPEVKLTNKIPGNKSTRYDVWEYRPFEPKAAMKSGKRAAPKRK